MINKAKYKVNNNGLYETIHFETEANQVIFSDEQTLQYKLDNDILGSSTDHNHNDKYLKLSGGTVDGSVNINENLRVGGSTLIGKILIEYNEDEQGLGFIFS